MEVSRLVLTVILVIQIRNSLQRCRVIERSPGVPNYLCDTIQDLEKEGNPDLLDVIINDSKSPLPAINTLPPVINITLRQPTNGGFTPILISSIEKLTKLLYSRTGLTMLTVDMFANIRLEVLQIKQGQIEKIQPGTFSNVNLRELCIIQNELTRIEYGVFNELFIETLALSDNKISVIEKNAFLNMKNLKNLYLDGNQISEFQTENLMNYVDVLESLHLQRNSFTLVNRNMLKGFANLRKLDLSENKISKIMSSSFEELLKLESLNLADNLLHEVKSDVFPTHSFPALLKFSIAANRLSYLTTIVLEKLRTVKFVSIGGNPWQCPCLNLIMIWIYDHNIEEVCDEHYFEGTRPICVVDNSNPNTCNFNDNKFHYYKYSEENNRFPKFTNCTL